MQVSERMRKVWKNFRAGQAAQKAGVKREDCPHRLGLINTSGPLSNHERELLEKAWLEGWDKPRK